MRRLFAVIMIATASASPGPRADPVPRVSLVQLIARPTDFDGQRVRVIGYVTIGFEDQALFLGPADFENGIFESSVELELGKREMPLTSNEYAMVEGIFHVKSPTTPVRLGVGMIDSITQIQPWFMSTKGKYARGCGCW